MKRSMMALFCAVLIAFGSAFASAAPASKAPNFERLAPALTALRSSADQEVSVTMNATQFRVRQLREATISAEEGQKVLDSKRGAPSLKSTRDGDWIVFEIDETTIIEQPVTASGVDPSRQWKKRTWAVLGSYKRRAWPQFLAFAIKNGLTGFRELRLGEEAAFELQFTSLSQPSIKAGRRTLALTPGFQAVMRFAPKYPAKSSGDAFAILLHDPHQNIGGRFQTVTGLRELISANPRAKFRFLVEGWYEGPSREIGFSDLDEALKRETPTTPAAVHSLLARFMIDVPMAYRLLYDRKISALAIDDLRYLKYDAPKPSRSLIDQIGTLQRVGVAALAHGNAGKDLAATALYARLSLTADHAAASSSSISGRLETIADLIGEVRTQCTALSRSGLAVSAADLTGLAQDEAALRSEAGIYKVAAMRNQSMISYIVQEARSQQSIPIAFIGSFHTEEIAAKLEEAGVSYIVIEPRPFTRPSLAENEAFDRAIHLNTRERYLQSIALNKGPGAPTLAEVQRFYRPKISAAEPRLTARRQAALAVFSSVSNRKIDAGRLRAAMDANGALALATVAGGGGNRIPPNGRFKKAFAYFEPPRQGSENEGGTIVILDPSDSRWTDETRYKYLSILPLWRTEDSRTPVKVARDVQVLAYHDRIDDRILSMVKDSDSGRIYLVEGSRQDTAALMAIPVGKPNEDLNLRTTVVEETDHLHRSESDG